MVQVITDCADRSTNWALPVFCMRAWAASAAAADSTPACRHTWGVLTRSGGRPEKPWRETGPPIAAMTRSSAWYPEYGPLSPKGDSRPYTSREFSCRSSSKSMP